MKRILVFSLFLLLFAAFVLPAVSAAGALLTDDADLLTPDEQEALLQRLTETGEKLNADVVIVTTDSLYGKSAREFADDFYDAGGYRADGVLLLVSTEDSDWYISTAGFGITALTDAGIDYLAEKFVGHLSNGDFYEAFSVFLSENERFFAAARAGEPFDTNNLPKDAYDLPLCIFVSLIVGVLLALIVVLCLKAQLKSVRAAHLAADYVIPGSLNVTGAEDRYLYTHTTRRAKPKSTSGSSTHVSSSGIRHGGGGGKF